MDNPLSVKDVRVLMDFVDNAEKVFPSTWTILDRLSSLEQMRDWFKVVYVSSISCTRLSLNVYYASKWTGLSLQSDQINPTRYIAFNFAHRDLPERPHHIEGISSEDLDPNLM